MLAIDNVQVRYANGALGIESITVNVAPGSVVALFGPNGAGKTTTVRAGSGFLVGERAAVTAGMITVDGENLTNREPHDYANAGVALVREGSSVFQRLTVKDNLRIMRRRLSSSIREQRCEFALSLFPVLRNRWTTVAGRLSGGEQQMLGIARSLMRGPRYLLIDEMTMGLHISLQRPLFEAVQAIAGSGTGVLVVDETTLSALDVTSYCYVIRGGRVVQEGPAATFAADGLLSAGYIGSGGDGF